MANIIQHKSGTASPASDALAKGELGIQFVAANHTAASSSKLHFGEGDSANLRQFGFGITDGSTQSGVAIGENLTFTAGSGISLSLGGTDDRELTITATGGSATTINNNSDDRILTATGSSSTINGEANLTFNGSTLNLTGNQRISGYIGRDNHNYMDFSTDNVIRFRVNDAQGLDLTVDGNGNTIFKPLVDGKKLIFQQYDGNPVLQIDDNERSTIVTDMVVGDDIFMSSDGAVLNFGADSDVNLTHVADTGLLLNSSRQLQFGDSGTYINQSTDGQLDIAGDTKIKHTSPLIEFEHTVSSSTKSLTIDPYWPVSGDNQYTKIEASDGLALYAGDNHIDLWSDSGGSRKVRFRAQASDDSFDAGSYLEIYPTSVDDDGDGNANIKATSGNLTLLTDGDNDLVLNSHDSLNLFFDNEYQIYSAADGNYRFMIRSGSTAAMEFDSSHNIDFRNGSTVHTTIDSSGNLTMSGNLTVGGGTDTDHKITFNGNTSDGVLTWMEDEDYFKFSDDLLIDSTEKIQFGDTGTYIHQSADGVLDLVSDSEIEINATTIDMNGAVDISGNLTVSGNLDFAGAARHIGDTDTNFSFTGSDTISIQAGGAERVSVNQSGMAIGTGARVTTILDEDNLVSDSATALATQQSIKAYVDANAGGSGTITGVTAGDGLTGGGSSGSVTLAVTAANTNLTSIINDDFTKLGRNAGQEYIDFTTTNQVNTHVNNVKVLSVTASGSDGKVNIGGSLNISDVAAAGSDVDKFLVLDGSGNVDYRTGAQTASDIGALTLSALSVGSDASASGGGGIAYDNSTGVFTYTPPAVLPNARAFQTNLASTSSANFDGSADNTHGVTGTLAVGNGGTGVTSMTSLKNALDDETWTFANVLTADAGIDVDDIHIDDNTVKSSSGNLKLSANEFSFHSPAAGVDVITVTDPSSNDVGGTNHGYAMKIKGTNSNGGGMLVFGGASDTTATTVTGFRAPNSLPQSLIYELPDDVPSAGEYLKVASYSSPVAQLEWASASGGGSIDGSGAANRLAFWSDSDTLTSDGDLTWDSSTGLLKLSHDVAQSQIELESTVSTGTSGPRMTFYRNSATPLSGDTLARLIFKGNTNDNGNTNVVAGTSVYADIIGKANTAIDGQTDGQLIFRATVNGTDNDEIMKVGANSSSGREVVPGGDNETNLGNSSAGWKGVYGRTFYGYDTSTASYLAGASESPSVVYNMGSEQLIIQTDGGIVTDLRSQSTSDENLKENITANTTGLSFINQLTPKNFTWKQSYADNNKMTENPERMGWIAQDVEKISSDYVEKIDYTEDGTEFLGLTNKFKNDLIAAQINAIKELSAKNDALEARIAALEAK